MNNNCGICYKELGDTNVSTFHCEHKFHFTCILTLYNMNKYYSTKCPYCRRSFYKEIQYESSDELTDDDSDDIPELISDDDIIEYRNMVRPVPPPAPRSSRIQTPVTEPEPFKKRIWGKIKEIYKNYQAFLVVIIIYTLFFVGDMYIPKDIIEVFGQHFKYLILTFIITFVYYIIQTYKTFEENCRVIMVQN